MAETITDDKGRKITLRVTTPSTLLRLAEAADDASSNGGFMNLATLYVLADEIDGVPVPFPQSKDDLYRTADLLGNEGVYALGQYLRGKKKVDEDEAAKN